MELLKYGIRVNAIIVAECWTPLYEKWIKTLPDPAAKLAEIVKKIPLGNRMTTAEEIANMAAFLLSERSSSYDGAVDPCGWGVCAFGPGAGECVGFLASWLIAAKSHN